MRNPARKLFRYALDGMEQRPIAQQIEILESIAECSNDVNESEALLSHAEDLKQALARITQLKLTFER